jgi:hypothetical protein
VFDLPRPRRFCCGSVPFLVRLIYHFIDRACSHQAPFFYTKSVGVEY